MIDEEELTLTFGTDEDKKHSVRIKDCLITLALYIERARRSGLLVEFFNPSLADFVDLAGNVGVDSVVGISRTRIL